MSETDTLRLTDVRLARDAYSDQTASRALLERVALPVRRVVLKLAGGRPEVQDYTQEALLAVLRSSRTYRGAGSLESWAASVAFRVTMRALRKQRQTERATRPESDLKRVGVSSGHSRELARRLQHHLDALPLKQAEALLLRVVMGYKVQEVAELTGVPPNTVRGRIRRGLTKLRRSMGRDEVMVDLLRECHD